MKRILFYVLLLFQISAVLLIVLQYNLIDKYGEERTFITEPYGEEYYEEEGYSEEDFYEEDIQDYEVYTFEFEMNNIPKKKWEGKKEYYYKDKVYVLLKENKAGLYEVVKATDKKITTDKENEIILTSKEIYSNEDKSYHVSYGFETINVKAHKKIFTDFNSSEATKVTYKFAPWNQSKIVSID